MLKLGLGLAMLLKTTAAASLAIHTNVADDVQRVYQRYHRRWLENRILYFGGLDMILR